MAALETRQNPRRWIEANLQLLSKDRQIIPFLLNQVQADYYQHRTPWDIILKPRQLGFTTEICGLFFADCLNAPNTTSVLMAHDLQSTEQIFQIAKLFWLRLPEEERRRVGTPKYDNRREFYWEKIGSRFLVGTAGSTKFGRGQTINNLHCSEFAFWPKPQEALAALTEAVPAEGRMVIESTANGVGTYFHDLWVAAKQGRNRFAPHYYVWFEESTYQLPPEPEEIETWTRQLQHLGMMLSGEESKGTNMSAAAPLTKDEISLMRRYHLSLAQIKWRRAKIRDLGEDLFRQEYPEDDVTCFLTTGRCCFDISALTAAQAHIAAELAPEIMVTLPDGDTNLSVAPARLLVWKRPEQNRLYVIGADVGEGITGGDASCACVLDKETGEQVAELHGRIPPERFGQLLAALGWWYNMATIAVERNNHGHSTLNTLRHVRRYPRLYYHVRYDRTGTSAPKLGWPTDQATKPILVDDLAAAIAGGHLLIHSSGLIDECFTFVTTDTGSQEAQEGKHDDRVIAAGIAWQARKRGVSRGIAERPPGW